MAFNTKSALYFIAVALTLSLIVRDSWQQVAGLSIVCLALSLQIWSERTVESHAEAIRKENEERAKENQSAIKEIKDKMDSLIVSSLGGGFR